MSVVEYRLNGDALVIDYAATTHAPTVLNLTNHAYFNLSGEASVLEHVLHIPSSRITALDAELIPTGEIRDIAGTPLDFRTPTAIGARIDQPYDQLQYGGGYDLNYALADAPRDDAGAGRHPLGRRARHDDADDRARTAILQRQFPQRRSVRAAQRSVPAGAALHRQPQPPGLSQHRAAARRAVRVAHLVSLRRRLSWRKPLVAFASRGTSVGLRQLWGRPGAAGEGRDDRRPGAPPTTKREAWRTFRRFASARSDMPFVTAWRDVCVGACCDAYQLRGFRCRQTDRRSPLMDTRQAIHSTQAKTLDTAGAAPPIFGGGKCSGPAR